jgi:hypothetical protein
MVSSLVLLLSAHAREAGIQFFGSWVPAFAGTSGHFIKLSANLF